MHFIEFACVEDECRSNPLMCYICKDYGRHVQHKVNYEIHVPQVKAYVLKIEYTHYQ